MTAPAAEKPKAKTKADIEAELADALEVVESLAAQNDEKAGKITELQDEIGRRIMELDELKILVNDGPSNSKTVHQAWSTAMAEVQAIGKDSKNTQQGFNFRGIDAVMNTVGPVLRRHGLLVVPRVLSESSERYESKNKALMVNRVVEIEFTVFGPLGDSFSGSAFGEASDSGDKSMSKAHSVAYRTFLLQSLTIPTDEPDPDASTYERAAAEQQNTRPAQQSRPQQERAPAAKTPADQERDLLRTLATGRGWDLGRIAQLFTEKVTVEGAPPADLRTAAANDIKAFRTNLEAGTIQV